MVMQSDSSIDAFSAAAGIAPAELSLLIRTALLTGYFIWSAWCVLEVMKYYKAHVNESISRLLKDYISIFFLVSVMITLVFVH